MTGILLSGLIGALIGSISTIIFTLWRDNRIEKRKISREKLEKVYGPLIALRQKINCVNQSKGGFLLPNNEREIEMIENIIFNQYHLIDNDLKKGILLLHPEINKHDINKARLIQMKIEEKIIKHYRENKKILGLE